MKWPNISNQQFFSSSKCWGWTKGYQQIKKYKCITGIICALWLFPPKSYVIWLPLQSGAGFFIFIIDFKREAWIQVFYPNGKFSRKKCNYGKNIVKTRLTLILMSQKWLPPMRLVRLFSRQTLDGWSYWGGIIKMKIKIFFSFIFFLLFYFSFLTDAWWLVAVRGIMIIMAMMLMLNMFKMEIEGNRYILCCHW